MAIRLPSLRPQATRRALSAAEWMAENAYIPPGAHRLLTAGGLTLGLWGGRQLMDTVVAKRADGSDMPRSQVAEIFRPIHGLMRYNTYSDEAAERWKSVVDKMAPMVLGGLGAWAGSKLYIHDLRAKPFSLASRTVLNNMKAGKATLNTADMAANITQGDYVRRIASPLFAIGSSTGTHLFGGLFPFTNSMSAQTFMLSIGRKLWIPGAGPVNRFFGNRSAGSNNLNAAMRSAAKWVEANVTKFDDASHWATDTELLARAKDALQTFRHATPEQHKAVAANMRKLIGEAYAHKGKDSLYGFITQGHGGKGAHGLFDVGFENLLKSSGVKLEQASLGNNGPFTVFSRLIGSVKGEKEVWKSYARHLNAHHGMRLDPQAFADSKVKLSKTHAALAYSGAAGLVGTGVALGAAAAHRMDRRADASRGQPGPGNEEKHGGNLLDWVNGKPLDAMQWMSRVAVNPPSMHRLMNAAYLSAALFGGMKLANIMTGRQLQLIRSGDLSKSLVTVEHIWKPLRPILKPLHGVLAYTPGSAALQDRWRQAAHFIIPVIPGAIGTYTGSHMFFRDRIASLRTPDTLEDYADRIALEQSKLHAGLTAVTSIFNTGSGIHLLPVFNYSSNLHNRYLLASGQQVAMPGIGKWWSGNAGLTPWGVKRSLQYLEDYLTFNPAARPREVSSLLHSVIGKLYPQLPEENLLARKQAVMNELFAVRDRFLTPEGTVAKDRLPELRSAMHDLLSGKGFEEALLHAGLDPKQANLANNGASGALSNLFGSKRTVESLQQEYRGKFAERLANHRPRSTAEIIAAHAGREPAPNDNAPRAANDNAQGHAARLRQQESHPAEPPPPGR